MKKIIMMTFMILIGTTIFVLPCFGDVIKGCYQKNNFRVLSPIFQQKRTPSIWRINLDFA